MMNQRCENMYCSAYPRKGQVVHGFMYCENCKSTPMAIEKVRGGLLPSIVINEVGNRWQVSGLVSPSRLLEADMHDEFGIALKHAQNYKNAYLNEDIDMVIIYTKGSE